MALSSWEAWLIVGGKRALLGQPQQETRTTFRATCGLGVRTSKGFFLRPVAADGQGMFASRGHDFTLEAGSEGSSHARHESTGTHLPGPPPPARRFVLREGIYGPRLCLRACFHLEFHLPGGLALIVDEKLGCVRGIKGLGERQTL